MAQDTDDVAHLAEELIKQESMFDEARRWESQFASIERVTDSLRPHFQIAEQFARIEESLSPYRKMADHMESLRPHFEMQEQAMELIKAHQAQMRPWREAARFSQQAWRAEMAQMITSPVAERLRRAANAAPVPTMVDIRTVIKQAVREAINEERKQEAQEPEKKPIGFQTEAENDHQS